MVCITAVFAARERDFRRRCTFDPANDDATLAALGPEALAEFIEDGHFAAHIRKVTRLYGERRDRLVQALTEAAGDRVSVAPPNVVIVMSIAAL